jgi:hypothetical protein
MSLPLCPFCQKEVLGLVGQDICLDTFYLQDNEEDKQIVEMGIYGMCHFLCLISDNLGNFWSKRILENMTLVRKFPIIAVQNNITLLRNNRMRETIAIRQDGWVAYIRDDALTARIELDQGCFIPNIHELNLDLSDHPSLADVIQTTLNQDRSYPIREIVYSLKLNDYTLYPEAIENGILIPRIATAGEKKELSEQYKTHINANAQYLIFLPQVVKILAMSSGT